ncbi:TadE/TadG family type IV pilus assembly protein [Nocardioides marmoribigeumensis]|uniref:Putative Flp pilus-assembly TadG-like N-terminal domain-containing protein n=1 Tax=Nocardioides marmoribigeumensis TaxID=433649 RepID=A0ABU2BRC8_9ACTN|nr:pilus assembly protein [Nocardioides marmoribigeumensis]MDR7360539.1 hypothetical protein [Nocardioides marmoribigeumensis]
MRIRFQRHREDRGAIAVIVAISATLLFVLAAMSVDLGNAWARARQSQSQADLAALAGGQELPAGDSAHQLQIAQVVADYLNDNRISSDQPNVTASALQDGNDANGEISFPKDTQLKVVPPLSQVNFGFASVIGANNVSVARTGTVEKRALTPKPDKILPMWLPASCVYGPVEGDTDPHTSPSASPTYSPASQGFTVSTRFHVTNISVNTTPYGTTTGSIDVTFSNENTVAQGTPAAPLKGAVIFTFGAPTAWAGNPTVYPVNLAIPGKVGSTPGTQTVTIPGVGPEVTSTVGKWEVWGARNIVAGTPVPGTTVFSADPGPASATVGSQSEPLVFEVTGGGGEVGCDDSERGNFGQIDSPRTGMTAMNKAYGYNIALGLDHKLKEFEPSLALPGVDITLNPECYSDGNPGGAKIDNTVRDGNNCIYVEAGNDPPYLTNGLLSGMTGGPDGTVKGRLFSADTSPLCTANGDKRAPAKADDGHFQWSKINRDTLSCYLKPGVTLADIAKDGSDFDLLDKSIEDSPRFFYVPIVYATDRTDKKYIAIKQFAPVFLTDETLTSGATADNGVQMNTGGTQVFAVQVFAFNYNAIPVDPDGEDVEWFDGGRAVVRLVD